LINNPARLAVDVALPVDFHASDYGPVQLSRTPILESQGSQGNDAVLYGAQLSSPVVGKGNRKPKDSQITIPDSQDPSQFSLSQNLVTEDSYGLEDATSPRVVEESSPAKSEPRVQCEPGRPSGVGLVDSVVLASLEREAKDGSQDSNKVSYKPQDSSSGQEIPSHQPESVIRAPLSTSLEDPVVEGAVTQKKVGLTVPKTYDSNSSSQGFLTQVAANFDNPGIESSLPRTEAHIHQSPSKSTPIDAGVQTTLALTVFPESRTTQSSGHSVHSAGAFISQPHFAQIIQPLSSNIGQIQTQSHDALPPYYSESDVVLDPVCREGRSTRFADPTSTNSSAAEIMDGTQAEERQLSAVERLARLSEEFFSSPPVPTMAPLDALFSSGQLGQHTPDPPLVSPSTALPPGDMVLSVPKNPMSAIDQTPDIAFPLPLATGVHVGQEALADVQLNAAALGEPISTEELMQNPLGLHIAMPLPSELDVPQTPSALLDLSAAANELPPVTIAPSELTNCPLDAVPGPSLEPLVETVLPGIESVDQETTADSPAEGTDEPMLPNGADSDEESNTFTVTIPLAANLRQHYAAAIDESQVDMMRFGSFFNDSQASGPGLELAGKMDALFKKLYDFCDLPASPHVLDPLTPEETKRYAMNTNGKYSFVYEFLDRIRDTEMRVLVISAKGRVAEVLDAVISTSGFAFSRLGKNDATAMKGPELTVIISQADQDFSVLSAEVDIVIAFDRESAAVELPLHIYTNTMSRMILQLITTNSIEHIERRLCPAELQGMERRAALNIALAEIRRLGDSVYQPQAEPHDLAEIFAAFVRDPDSDLSWEPQELPDNVIDVWLNSQSLPMETQENIEQLSLGRKRPLVCLAS
jgi:hypothetical protein